MQNLIWGNPSQLIEQQAIRLLLYAGSVLVVGLAGYVFKLLKKV